MHHLRWVMYNINCFNDDNKINFHDTCHSHVVVARPKDNRRLRGAWSCASQLSWGCHLFIAGQTITCNFNECTDMDFMLVKIVQTTTDNPSEQKATSARNHFSITTRHREQPIHVNFEHNTTNDRTTHYARSGSSKNIRGSVQSTFRPTSIQEMEFGLKTPPLESTSRCTRARIERRTEKNNACNK